MLVLTTYDQDEFVFDALASGASGFLLKDARPEDLISGIRSIAARDALLAPSVTRRLIGLFARGRTGKARQAAGQLELLTECEREVLGSAWSRRATTSSPSPWRCRETVKLGLGMFTLHPTVGGSQSFPPRSGCVRTLAQHRHYRGDPVNIAHPAAARPGGEPGMLW